MADEDDGAVGPPRLGQEQIDELAATVRVKRRGGLVGDNQFGPADQGACRGDALLLSNAQVRRPARTKLLADAQCRKQPGRRFFDRAVGIAGAL